MEIKPEVKAAWREVKKMLNDGDHVILCENILADFARDALAATMKWEFEAKHKCQFFHYEYVEGVAIAKGEYVDVHHNWSFADWCQGAERRLMGE